MLNPWIILAVVLAFAGSNAYTYHYALDVAAGRQAARDLEVADAYYAAARRNAKVESAEAVRKAKAAAEARIRAEATRHNLELELERDEAARTCRVSDGTFGVLNDAVRAANGTLSKDKAGTGNGSGQPAAGTERPDSTRTGPVDRAGGGAVR